MKKFQFYPIDITYKVIENKAIVYLFGRTANNEQVCIADYNFKPYFYAVLKEEDSIDEFIGKIKKIKLEEKEHISEVIDTEIVDKKILGKNKKAIKIFVRIPSDVPLIRKAIKDWYIVESTYEFDIPFVRRYLIDNEITPLVLTDVEGDFANLKCRVPVFKAEKIKQTATSTIEKPRMLAFDIEIYNPNGKRFNPEDDPIVMLSFYGDNFKKVITWKRFETDLDYIEFVKGEVDLLERFKEVIEQYKPDIITGYFSDGFDLPYIIARARRYNIPLDIGLDYSFLKIKKRLKSVGQVNGIVHLDIFKFIAKVMGRSMDTETYSLRKVSSELLGDTKKEVDIDKLAYVWDNELEKIETYCEYNLHDSYLAYQLAVKMLPNIKELVKIIGLPINDLSRMGFSQLIEWYVMKNLKDFNEIAPNKPNYYEVGERREKTYKGAFVYEPEPGLYNDVVVFDFRSLYPTIIASHNIGLSTLNCECCRDTAELVPAEKSRYWFCKKTKGFIPKLVENLITRRMRIKEMMKDNKDDALLKARSNVLKLLANSFYGYLGFFGSRWYSIECANSVTAYGRHYITKVIDKAKEEGFKVLYGDTDSIFLALQDKTEEKAKDFVEKINSELPGLMELEFENYFKRGIFVSAKEGSYGAKKKYAMIDKDNKMKIKGFETIRGNWSPVAKETQLEVLRMILEENDVEQALKYARDIIIKLKEKKIDKSKVIIHTQLNKELNDYVSIGPHVAIGRLLKARGHDIGAGSRIDYIVTSGKGIIRDRVKIPDETEDYDSVYYINNQVIPAVESIFKVLGFEKEELLGNKKQSKLESFF